jgi:hypothetical protein
LPILSAKIKLLFNKQSGKLEKKSKSRINGVFNAPADGIGGLTSLILGLDVPFSLSPRTINPSGQVVGIVTSFFIVAGNPILNGTNTNF